MIRSIDMTPTWSDILPTLLFAYESAEPAGRKVAFEELRRMAAIASDAVAEQAATELTAAEIEPAREIIFKAETSLRRRLSSGERRDLLKDNTTMSSHAISAVVSALSIMVRPDENIGSCD